MAEKDKPFGADYSKRTTTPSALEEVDGVRYDIDVRFRGQKDSEDDRMSGGLSLALGSDAYEEYVEERQGMDEFERERADKARDGFGAKKDLEAPEFDEFHERRYQALSNQEQDIAVREERTHESARRVRQQIQSYRIVKENQMREIIDHARRTADASASTRDDEFVNDHLGGIMEGMVNDQTVKTLDGQDSKTQDLLEELSR